MKVVITIANLLFLAGTVVLLILTMIGGSLKKLPMGEFYWLKADTSNIPGAYNETAWTFWGICQANDFSDCKYGPAVPIEPVSNFNTTEGVPQAFVDNQSTYYYLSRFAWAFTFVSITFAAFALILAFVGFCWGYINFAIVFLTSVCALFLAATCALQTAVVVMARENFNEAGMSAHVQTKSMALLWTSLVTVLIVWLISIAGLVTASYKKHMGRDTEASLSGRDDSSFTRATAAKEDPNGGGIRFFKIKRNAKDLDDESV